MFSVFVMVVSCVELTLVSLGCVCAGDLVVVLIVVRFTASVSKLLVLFVVAVIVVLCGKAVVIVSVVVFVAGNERCTKISEGLMCKIGTTILNYF